MSISSFLSTWPLLRVNERGRYTPLGKESYQDGAQAAVAGPRTWSSLLTWRCVMDITPWMFTLFFAVSTLWLLFERNQKNPLGSFATGWATDFVTAHAAIEARQVRFTGSPSFHDNKTIYIPNPDPVQYVGEPSLLIDQHWETLTWGRYVLITEDEAHAAWGQDIDDFWDDERGGYVAGLDMFHTLHCLNNIRKALHPTYYSKSTDNNNKSNNNHNHLLHQDHCIEQIRQYIMCSGDMTPIPTKYYAALGRNYVNSDVPHTCRDFERLRQWVLDRYQGQTAVQPQPRGGGLGSKSV